MAGPLFRELAEYLAKAWAPAMLYTGHPHTVSHKEIECLNIISAPEYNRTNNLNRLLSWMNYFVKAVNTIWKKPKNTLLFIVSNPPFLGLVGLLFKWSRGQQYVMLVYDIYPDLLIGLGRLRNGVFSRCWDFLNRLVYQNSSIVITIGQDMAHRLETKIKKSSKERKNVICIPCWADTEKIKPLKKDKNWFAKQHGLIGKTVVLYSGNMGHTHNIESILEVAKKLREERGIQFLFIGEGAKQSLLKKSIKEFNLNNVMLLPFQSEEILPYSLTAGDIGVIAYQKGTESCMIPSKAYYYMAAGLALFVISNQENDLTTMVQKKRCGVWVKNSDIVGMASAIKELHNNTEDLNQYKKVTRKTAEEFYSKKNCELFLKALCSHFEL